MNQYDTMLPMIHTKASRTPEKDVIQCTIGKCALGSMLIAISKRGICAITLGDDPKTLLRDLQDRFPKAELIRNDQPQTFTGAITSLIEDPHTHLPLPLDIRGTAFQRKVWNALEKIPRGETATYTDIARRIGKPKAIRAVAQACAANHLAVVIPCHRVVRSDGALSGYRWGVSRKAALLKSERTSKQNRLP